MTDQQLAVVTGASSGIGEATARRLSQRGYHVLAGVRRQADAQRLAADHLEPVVLDVTDPAHVAHLAARVREDPSGRPLRVLVNNAGVTLSAPAELVPDARWREHFDVNLFGLVAVTTALLPALLAAGDARLVNVSSVAAVLASPTFGPYAASKAAVEAYSDVLRREVARLGVAVVVVQPGAVRTPIWAKGTDSLDDLTRDMTPEQHDRYDPLLAAVRRQAGSQGGRGVEATTAAEVILGAVEARRPRPRYLVGRDAQLAARLTHLLSDRAVDRLLARLLRLP
jgi:NAD(P)-dependent dehydrogenase (short-subunit alcohol dehydrogenase family)